MQVSFISVVTETWEKFIIQYHLVPRQWNKMVCKEWHYKDKTKVVPMNFAKFLLKFVDIHVFKISFTVLCIGLKKRSKAWKAQLSRQHNFDFILVKPRESILYVSE